jgi:hypothetical protein
MSWTVKFTNTARRGVAKLPAKVHDAVEFLTSDMETAGPVLPRWPHYGKITGHSRCHHCHILRGRPTYVAVWRETGDNEIEVSYVGTHEGADYGRLC